MQKLHKHFNVTMEPQSLTLPLYTQSVTWLNGNKSTAEMHFHTCEEIGLCLSGSGIFFIDDRVQSFTAGSVSFMPRNSVHIAQSPDASPSEWRFIFVDLEKAGIKSQIKQGICIADRDCRNLFNMLFDDISKKDNKYEQMFSFLMQCLLICFERLLREIPLEFRTRNYNFYKILPAINFISQNYEQEIHVGKLANMCGISSSLLYKLFDSATGMSPIEYVNSVRISSAENLLIFSKRPIIDISTEVGFPNVSSFYRQFKKVHLISPREFRYRYQEAPSEKQ